MNDEGIREVASKGSVGQAKAENPIAEVDEGKLAETLEEQMKELVALKKYRRESTVVDWYPRDLENVYLAARSSSSLTEAREKFRKIRLRKELEAVLDWESDGGMIRALGQYDPSRIVSSFSPCPICFSNNAFRSKAKIADADCFGSPAAAPRTSVLS